MRKYINFILTLGIFLISVMMVFIVDMNTLPTVIWTFNIFFSLYTSIEWVILLTDDSMDLKYIPLIGKEELDRIKNSVRST